MWQFNVDYPDNFTPINSPSFKYKGLFGNPAAVSNNGVLKGAKIAVSLKYLSNVWRSLEMSLINCKIQLKLSRNMNCVVSSVAGNT